MTDYSDFPDHPLARVTQETLDIARKVLLDSEVVERKWVEPLADAILCDLVEEGLLSPKAFG